MDAKNNQFDDSFWPHFSANPTEKPLIGEYAGNGGGCNVILQY